MLFSSRKPLALLKISPQYCKQCFQAGPLLGIDAGCRSGGIALGFNLRTTNLCNCSGGHGYLGADLFLADLGLEIRAINVYGSCQHMPEFLDRLLNSELYQKDFHIMGGDLNFSIGHAESWGRRAQIDPLSVYFENVLEVHNLKEIPITNMQPT